jgi:molecular chaperone DnaK
VRKTLQDHGDKVSEGERKDIEEKIRVLEEAAKGEDTAKITSALEDLMRASHKLAEEVYKQGAQQHQAAQEGAGGTPPPTPEPASEGDEKIIDADFEVKD